MAETTDTKRAKLLWLDLEMTGLDPDKDLIVEIAAIATDWDFTELGVFEGIVKHDDGQLRDLFAGNNQFWDANPTSRDGLLEQNPQGSIMHDVERAILDFLDAHFDEGPITLAGNSIHMDRLFIRSQWKQLDARLHYRMLDVSAWKLVFEAKYKKKFAKPNNHRALDDIRGSISELKYYLGKVRV